VFSTTDFFGNMVVLEENTWRVHILDPTVGHPQLVGCEHLVRSVLEEPEVIRVSTQFCDTAAFISAPGVGPRPEGIRVLVTYDDTSYEKGATSGKVMTAYPIDVMKYGHPRLGKILYQKAD
jgi:hypothetical protein